MKTAPKFINIRSEITCISCPIGCRISVTFVNDEPEFAGNKCKKGAEFAFTEMTSPMRSLTTTVKTIFDNKPVLPVRTNGEIPKEKIDVVIRELSGIIINRKIGIGEIIVKNILGTGCDVIATDEVNDTLKI